MKVKLRYLLKIAFDGTDYHGWQVQPNGITVQQKLQECMEALFKVRPNVSGCSRTDSGVHANEFFCHFDLEKAIPEIGIVKGINAFLPKDIRAFECRKVDDNFHCRYDAVAKNYIYRFDTSNIQSPLEHRYAYHYPFALNTDLMNLFCEKIIGTHDFIGFSSSGRSVENTERTVYNCFVSKKENIIELSITGNGFLYNMVRIVAGTALAVGNGKIKISEINTVINSKERSMAGVTLPPNGLILNKVYYSGDTEYGRV